MAYKFPEGGKFLVSSTFAAVKTLLTMSNADPTVAGCVGHGYVDGDELLINSGWEDATSSIFRVKKLTNDTFQLLGLETGDVAMFPANGGDNTTVQKISNWFEVPQVLTIASSGGGPRTKSVSPVFRRNALKFTVGFEATDITLSLGHDASDANYQAMLKLSRKLARVAFKLQLADGAATYGYGNMAVGEMPELGGEVNTVPAVFNLQGRAISY